MSEPVKKKVVKKKSVSKPAAPDSSAEDLKAIRVLLERFADFYLPK